MLESFLNFNKDNILLYVSVPESDTDLFKTFESDKVKIISDESYAKNHFASHTDYGFGLGYVNQQICKLCFFEASLCENYLCIDADVIFIRDFYISDFMNGNTPYSVLVMDKELSTQREYQPFWDERQRYIKKIYEEVGLDDNRFRTCHGMQCLNSTVLSSLRHDFMEPKNIGYKNLIEISPFEFSWYNAWLQKSKVIEIIEVEPFFKTFHNKTQYVFSQLQMIRKSDLARAYVGIVLNSNWAKKYDYKNPGLLCKIFHKVLKPLFLKSLDLKAFDYKSLFGRRLWIRIKSDLIKNLISCGEKLKTVKILLS